MFRLTVIKQKLTIRCDSQVNVLYKYMQLYIEWPQRLYKPPLVVYVIMPYCHKHPLAYKYWQKLIFLCNKMHYFLSGSCTDKSLKPYHKKGVTIFDQNEALRKHAQCNVGNDCECRVS